MPGRAKRLWGSGKTTTLYSILHALDNEHQNIVAIEDPIEFRIPSFLQIEVDARHNVTPARALKTVLRMDPDVILLGEIRDTETAAIAIRAEDTGSYVFSTVHARDAASVLTAMRDLRIDERSLASNLRAVIAQRLVRTVCSNCGQRRQVTDDERDQFIQGGVDPPDTLVTSRGCEKCKQTGFLGRVGVYEVVENSPTIAAAIQQGVAEAELRQMFRERGVSSLATDGLQKVAAGMTDFEEIDGMAWVAPVVADTSADDGVGDARSAFWET